MLAESSKHVVCKVCRERIIRMKSGWSHFAGSAESSHRPVPVRRYQRDNGAELWSVQD